MKLNFVRSLCIFTIIFSLLSCASSPAPEQTKPDTTIPDSLIKSRKAADDSRAKALAIKADVAAKESFSQAETSYASGTTQTDTKEYDKAVLSYDDSNGKYKKAFDEATLKRQAALDAMKKAEEDRKSSEQAILDAEKAEKGGSEL